MDAFSLPLTALVRRAPCRLFPVLHTSSRARFRLLRHRKLKKLRKCTCCSEDDAPGQAADEDVPARRGTPCPIEEAAYFSDQEDEDATSAPGDSSGGKTPSNASKSKDNAHPEPCEKCTKLFYAELDKYMKDTAKAYFGWVSRILSAAPLEDDRSWWQKALGAACAPGGGGGCRGVGSAVRSLGAFTKAFGAAGSAMAAENDFAPDLSSVDIDLQTEAKECLHWIELNSTALRKILKKWDKTNHSDKGRQTLRKYWSDSKYQMLYSPLILELRAVAGMLQGGEEGPHWEDDDLQFSGVGLNSDPGDETSQAFAPQSAVNKQILSCGICLDTLYKPVGLSCGHVFCRDCLLQSAGILKEGATLGDLRTDPTSVHDDFVVEEEEAAGSDRARGATAAPSGEGESAGGAPGEPTRRRKIRVRKDRCPECRQTDVFATSVRLRHVQECLRQVDPEGYKARKAESKKYRKQLENDARLESIVQMLIKVAAPRSLIN